MTASKSKNDTQKPVPLSSLKPGQRFYMLLEVTGRRLYGTVIRITPASVTVKNDPRGPKRTFACLNKETGRYITVEDSPCPTFEHWALETPVYLAEKGEGQTKSEQAELTFETAP